MIEAVVFDWGGVLAGDISTGFADLEERLGVAPGSMPELLGLFPTATDPANLWHQRELGRATALEWAQLVRRPGQRRPAGPPIPVDLLVASEGERFTIEPNAEIVDLVRRLALDRLSARALHEQLPRAGDRVARSAPHGALRRRRREL